jgi:hypothetical protein
MRDCFLFAIKIIPNVTVMVAIKAAIAIMTMYLPNIVLEDILLSESVVSG